MIVILSQANKLLDILLLLGTGPFTDSTNEAAVRVDTLLGDNMTEELGLFLHEGAFAQLRIETMLAEEGQDTADVGQVLRLGPGVDQNIVQVDDNPLVEDGIEDS